MQWVKKRRKETQTKKVFSLPLHSTAFPESWMKVLKKKEEKSEFFHRRTDGEATASWHKKIWEGKWWRGLSAIIKRSLTVSPSAPHTISPSFLNSPGSKKITPVWEKKFWILLGVFLRQIVVAGKTQSWTSGQRKKRNLWPGATKEHCSRRMCTTMTLAHTRRKKIAKKKGHRNRKKSNFLVYPFQNSFFRPSHCCVSLLLLRCCCNQISPKIPFSNIQNERKRRFFSPASSFSLFTCGEADRS